jgi:predicted heme/steroid binding protein
MKKKIVAGSVFAFIVVAIVFIACASTPYKETRAVPDKSFTVAELAKFNGRDGNKAFVAYQGVVYDFTGVKSWKNGEHKDGKKAGNDYTAELDKVWHGAKVLKDKPIVGKLVK